MKKFSGKYIVRLLPVKIMVVMMVIAGTVAMTNTAIHTPPATDRETPGPGTDSIESVKAFLKVYNVLMSPRCMNCHPAGDQPLQGDDSHVHTMNVQRGADGTGLYALKCSNCHQPENTQGEHTPPGNPKWQLPPSDMKMVFQGKSAHELAKQIMDYNLNGHKNKKQLIEHARDTLVKAAWHMGEGRTPPPMSYRDFVVAWDKWIRTGAYAPKKN